LRKKKKKYANVIMLLLLLFVLFYVVLQDRTIKVTVNDLVYSYTTDIKQADIKFLNKEIELTGKVKLFLQTEAEKSLLELETGTDKLQLYCILMNKEVEEIAAELTSGTTVAVIGRCLGFDPSSVNKFPNSIYIEAEQIR
jgi:hypothetical protein